MNLGQLFFSVIYYFLQLLPVSPIAGWIDEYVNGPMDQDLDVIKVLHYINYFIPIGKMVTILTFWVPIMLLVYSFYTLMKVVGK